MHKWLISLTAVPVAHDLEWRTSFSSSPPSFSPILHLHNIISHILLLLSASLLSWAQERGRRRNSSWKKPSPPSVPLFLYRILPATPPNYYLPSELTRIHVVLFIFVTHSVDCDYHCIQMYYTSCLIKWKFFIFSVPLSFSILLPIFWNNPVICFKRQKEETTVWWLASEWHFVHIWLFWRGKTSLKECPCGHMIYLSVIHTYKCCGSDRSEDYSGSGFGQIFVWSVWPVIRGPIWRRGKNAAQEWTKSRNKFLPLTIIGIISFSIVMAWVEIKLDIYTHICQSEFEIRERCKKKKRKKTNKC